MLHRRMSVLVLTLLCCSAVARAADPNAFFYGLTDTSPQQFVTFRSDTGGGSTFPIVSATYVIGLQTGENLLRIRHGPDNGLYAISSQNRLYGINPGGAAAPIGTFGARLDGTAVGFAVNSAADEATIVTNLGQNLRIDLSTGRPLSVGGSLTYAAGQVDPTGKPMSGSPIIQDVAYSPGPSPQLFGLDAHSGTLVRIEGAGDPSGARVYTITTPTFNGVNAIGAVSPLSCLDFLPSGAAVYTFPSHTANDVSTAVLNEVNPVTGIPGPTLGYLGDAAVQLPLRSITVPEPLSIGAFAAALLLRRRRR